MSKKRPYHEQIAERLIEQLQQGTAPWQKPWAPGERSMPHNPVSGTRYKGANALWLEMQGRGDPRWLTYKQAQKIGAQVRKGEKSTPIQYWKFSEERTKRDESGKPVIGEDGKPEKMKVQLEKPKVFWANVFNGEQVEGLPPLERPKDTPEAAFERHERAEKVLANTDVSINHVNGDRAFYRPSTDSITLPEKEQFHTPDGYYATAMHEMGHATGHPSRLNRDLTGPFGSEQYAREELKAEVASLLIGDELGIGHDPGQHAAYVGSWIKVLQEDSKEIVRAARDAEHIMRTVTALENSLEHSQEVAAQYRKGDPEPAQEQGQEREAGQAQPMPSQVAQDREPEGPLTQAEKEAEAVKDARDVAEYQQRHQEGPAESKEAVLKAIGDAHKTTHNTYGSATKWGGARDQASFLGARAFSEFSSGDTERSLGTLRRLAAMEKKESDIQNPVFPGVVAQVEKYHAQQQAKGPTYLNVPYREKDEAKALGAKWDRKQKSWYAPAGMDTAPFSRWMGQQQESKPAEAQFAEALADNGLKVQGTPQMDGQLHRVPVEGDRKGQQSGAYVGYTDGHPAGMIQNFRAGTKVNWKADGVQTQPISAKERERMEVEAKAKREERAAERQAGFQARAQDCAQEWGRMKQANPGHSYLASKGVQAHGIKEDEQGRLAVPAIDTKGQLWSLQRIASQADGGSFKGFDKGTQKEGHFHAIGGLGAMAEADTLMVAEGYATGATIHEATGRPVAVAFDSNNLPAVAQALKEEWPDKQVVIAADNDQHQEAEKGKNPGLEKAKEAAEAVGGGVAVPYFTRVDRSLSDFNDMEREDGRASVQTNVEAAVALHKKRAQEIQAKQAKETQRERQERSKAKTVGVER